MPTSSPLTTSEIVEATPVRRRASRLSLPSNATSIRSDIKDNFSCDGKAYGYYADVDNDCQIFHVCLPVTYPDGKGQQFRWSFICPEDTTFNQVTFELSANKQKLQIVHDYSIVLFQEAFTCVRTDEMPFSCADSEHFYDLNRYLGLRDEVSEEIGNNALDATSKNESRLKISDRRQSLRITSTPSTTTTTPTTPTTANTSTTERREMPSRFPIFRRTSTKIVRHTTTTSAPTETTTASNIASTNSAFESTETRERTENDFTDRTTSYDNLIESTEFPSTATSSVTTFEDIISTAGEPVPRIVPELIEVGSESVDKTEAEIADDVVQNIKQLQNLLPMRARKQENTQQNASIASTQKTIEDKRRKRFLFTADAIENRRHLFNRLNVNKN